MIFLKQLRLIYYVNLLCYVVVVHYIHNFNTFFLRSHILSILFIDNNYVLLVKSKTHNYVCTCHRRHEGDFDIFNCSELAESPKLKRRLKNILYIIDLNKA